MIATDLVAAGLDVRKTAELARTARREAVKALLAEGVSWAKIAKRLDCAPTTVEKDIAWLRARERQP